MLFVLFAMGASTIVFDAVMCLPKAFVAFSAFWQFDLVVLFGLTIIVRNLLADAFGAATASASIFIALFLCSSRKGLQTAGSEAIHPRRDIFF